MNKIIKKIVVYFLSALLVLSLCLDIYASSNHRNEFYELSKIDSYFDISFNDISNSTFGILSDDNNNNYVRIVRKCYSINSDEYCVVVDAIYPDSLEDCYLIMNTLNDIKGLSRGGSISNSLDDWFYGSSVHISTTINFSKITDGLVYLKANNASYACTVNSGTVLDSVSVDIGFVGYKYGGGYDWDDLLYTGQPGHNTIYYPTTWPYILSDSSCTYGCHVTAYVHRPSGVQSSYTLYFDGIND